RGDGGKGGRAHGGSVLLVEKDGDSRWNANPATRSSLCRRAFAPRPSERDRHRSITLHLSAIWLLCHRRVAIVPAVVPICTDLSYRFLQGESMSGFKRSTLRAGVLAVALTLGGAGSALAADLRLGLAADVSSLDPHYLNIAPNVAMSAHFFDALVNVDADG